MNTIGSLTLGSKLAVNLNANVYVINYITSPNSHIQNVVFPLTAGCANTKNETGRAKLIEASYKAFHDLRRILKNYSDSATIKNIDPENFFMIGSSAGAVLAINTLFLQKEEIDSLIVYHDSCAILTHTDTIKIDSNIRNDYWPIPKMKGIVPMAGAWIYDNVSNLTANTPSSTFNTSIYLLHGTCDEIVHRKEGKIGFKTLLGLANTFSANRFINGKGSHYIFNAFKDTHEQIAYGQVYKGGHSIFNTNSGTNQNGWDIDLPSYPNDPVTEHIQPFIQNLILSSANWQTHTEVWNPDKITDKCKDFDNFNDTICYKDFVVFADYYKNLCDFSTKTIIINNPIDPLIEPHTVTWSTTGNVQIIGSNIGDSIQYKRLNTTNTNGVLIATFDFGCFQKSFTYLINITDNPLRGIYIDYSCANEHMDSSEYKIWTTQSAILTSYYNNALHEGIYSLNWNTDCGIPTFTDNYFVGSTLVSKIGVTGTYPCTYVNTSVINECGQTKQVSGNFRISKCKSYSLFITPNPVVNELKINLDDDEVITKSSITIQIIDPMGYKVDEHRIFSTSEKLDISQLKAGVYKILVIIENEAYHSTFIKN